MCCRAFSSMLALAAGLLAALGVAGAVLGATPVGSEFQLDTCTTADQRFPGVAIDAEGPREGSRLPGPQRT